MKNFIQNIKKRIDKWLFDWRKERAIKKAERMCQEQRRKFLVLVYRGKSTVFSMQQIKHLIRTKKLRGTPDLYREIALATVYPK